MLQIVIPKDMSDFEPTLIGSLSTRKVACGGVALILVYLIWGLEKKAGIVEPAYVPIWGIPALLGVLFGWIKPYGLHMEQFIANAFVSNVLAPKYRTLQIDNLTVKSFEAEKYEGLTPEEIKKIKAEEEKEKKSRKKRQKAFKPNKNTDPENIPYR